MDARVAVVTGGGTGIGRAVAATLVARGDRVAILGRRPEVLEKTAGELGCAWRQADVIERDQVQAAVDWVVAESGPAIDVLVNNADEIAAAAYLTSPEAGYVNGEVHHVNGGWVTGR
jgi:NAD(P)-dependent dehydrogenase (short-subunit alcohol dehydrogenase family)